MNIEYEKPTNLLSVNDNELAVNIPKQSFVSTEFEDYTPTPTFKRIMVFAGSVAIGSIMAATTEVSTAISYSQAGAPYNFHNLPNYIGLALTATAVMMGASIVDANKQALHRYKSSN